MSTSSSSEPVNMSPDTTKRDIADVIKYLGMHIIFTSLYKREAGGPEREKET